jgi:hypothetical protein
MKNLGESPLKTSDLEGAFFLEKSTIIRWRLEKQDIGNKVLSKK